jgi:hypothetical protein
MLIKKGPANDQITEDEKARQDKRETSASEEVDGIKRVADQALYRKQVQNDLQRTAQSKLRFAEPSGMVPHRYFDDISPYPSGVRWDETMHLTIEMESFEDITPVGFQCASVVMKLVPRFLGYKSFSDA